MKSATNLQPHEGSVTNTGTVDAFEGVCVRVATASLCWYSTVRNKFRFLISPDGAIEQCWVTHSLSDWASLITAVGFMDKYNWVDDNSLQSRWQYW